MKGFILEIGKDTIYAALESGSVGIIISNKDGNYNISLNGMDDQGIFYVWYNKNLSIGDSMTLKYEIIEQIMVSKPSFIRDVRDEESENKLLLDSYYKLKQELLDEGLISE